MRWSRRTIRYAVSGLTALALAGALAAIPLDECGASVSGACVDVGDFPFADRAAIGETGEVALGRITVDKASAAAELVREGKTYDTPDGTRWVVIDVTATVADKPRRLAAVLQGGVRSFTPDERVGLPVAGPQPGLPTTARFAFQVPDDAADAGLTAYVRFGAGTSVRVPLPDLVVADSLTVGESE